MSSEDLYTRLGGRDGIRAFVDDLYDQHLADEEVGPIFEGADMEQLRKTQTDFLCEAVGGPESYDAESVREAFLHVPFTTEHIGRAVELLSRSLDEFDVPKKDAERIVGA